MGHDAVTRLEVLDENPVEWVRMPQRRLPRLAGVPKCIGESLADNGLHDRGAQRRAGIEVAREDDRHGRAVLANVVVQHLVHLARTESVVAGAFDVGVVDDHAARPHAEHDAAASPRLKRIEAPPQTGLVPEGKDRSPMDRITTQDGLTGEGRKPVPSFPDLLELPGEHPVQIERFGEIASDLPIAATTTLAVHLLQGVDIGIEVDEYFERSVELATPGDVPRHYPDLAWTGQSGANACRFTDNQMDVAVGDQRLGTPTGLAQQTAEHP